MRNPLFIFFTSLAGILVASAFYSGVDNPVTFLLAAGATVSGVIAVAEFNV
jgi:hypothetical protein